MNYFPALLFSIPTFDDIADDIEDEKPKNQCTARPKIRKEDGSLPRDVLGQDRVDWASNICREFDCDQYQCMGYTDTAGARGGCVYITQNFIDNAPDGYWDDNPMPMLGACEPVFKEFMNKDPKRTGEIVIRLDDDEDISREPTDGEDNELEVLVNEPPFKNPTGKCVGGGSDPKDGHIKKGQCVRSAEMCSTRDWEWDNTNCGFSPYVCCEMDK